MSLLGDHDYKPPPPPRDPDVAESIREPGLLREAALSAIAIAEDGSVNHSYSQPAGTYFRAIVLALRTALSESGKGETPPPRAK